MLHELTIAKMNNTLHYFSDGVGINNINIKINKNKYNNVTISMTKSNNSYCSTVCTMIVENKIKIQSFLDHYKMIIV